MAPSLRSPGGGGSGPPMERVEGAPGEALAARARFLAAQAGAPGPGQPDLCWLERRGATGGGGGQGRGATTGGAGAGAGGENEEAEGGSGEETELQSTTVYHWALGQEVSSAAALAAYVARCAGEAETAASAPAALLGGFLAQTLPGAAVRRAAERSVAASSRRVARGVYCCYDLFARVDVRVEVAVPGGARAFALDAHGIVRDLAGADLHGAVASAFLRWSAWDGASTAELGCVRAGGWFREASGEAAALEALDILYCAGRVQPLRAAAHLDPGLGAAAEDFDPFAAAVLFLFISTGRATQAAAWFGALAKAAADPVLRLYEAAALKAEGGLDEALDVLRAALRASAPSVASGREDSPKAAAEGGAGELRRMAEEAHAALLCAEGALVLESGDAAGAGERARQALTLDADYRPAGLLLARALATSGSPTLALASLNACPPPPEADAPTELLLATPPLPRATVCAPGARSETSHLWAAGALSAAEEAALDLPGRAGLAGLAAGALFPGAALAGPLGDRRIAPQGAQPLRLPALVRAAAFDILVELAGSAGGWEAFLAARAEVFRLEGVTPPKPVRSQVSPPHPPELDTASSPSEGASSRDEVADGREVDSAGGGTRPSLPGDGADAMGGAGAASGGEGLPPPPEPPSPCEGEVSSGARIPDPEVAGGGGGEEVASTFRPLPEEEEREEDYEDDEDSDDDDKVLCEVWLDELIQALYEDLTEYVELQRYRRKVRRFSGLGVEDEDSEEEGEAGEGGAPATVGDWLRWGALCERLGQLDSAARCFEAVAADNTPSTAAGGGPVLLAWTALLRLQSQWGLTHETVTAAAGVLEGLCAAGALPVDAEYPPVEVTAALCSAVARAGLQATCRAASRELSRGGGSRGAASGAIAALGSAFAAIGLAKPRALPPRALDRLLSHALLECVRWQSAGFQR